MEHSNDDGLLVSGAREPASRPRGSNVAGGARAENAHENNITKAASNACRCPQGPAGWQSVTHQVHAPPGDVIRLLAGQVQPSDGLGPRARMVRAELARSSKHTHQLLARCLGAAQPGRGTRCRPSSKPRALLCTPPCCTQEMSAMMAQARSEPPQEAPAPCFETTSWAELRPHDVVGASR